MCNIKTFCSSDLVSKINFETIQKTLFKIIGNLFLWIFINYNLRIE